jgi:hypothetical protein
LSTIVLALALTGCASTPPPLGELAAADAALGAARAAGAADFAPVEYGFAQQKRERAAQALDQRDNAAARQLALQAEADAVLAEAKSRAAAGRAAVQQKTRANAELRRELLGEDGR